MLQTTLPIHTRGKGLYIITDAIHQALEAQLPEYGILNCFIQHTSASLVIQENADPSAKRDLGEFLERLVPENQAWHQHTLEGPDDTTSHLKSSITQTSLVIPIRNGRLALGTWQGVYLWEHRNAPHTRNLVLTVLP